MVCSGLIDLVKSKTKQSKFTTLFQSATKSMTNLLWLSLWGMGLGQRSQMSVKAQRRVDADDIPIDATDFGSMGLEQPLLAS